METLTGLDKNGNAVEFENMGVIRDNEWKEWKNGECENYNVETKKKYVPRHGIYSRHFSQKNPFYSSAEEEFEKFNHYSIKEADLLEKIRKQKVKMHTKAAKIHKGFGGVYKDDKSPNKQVMFIVGGVTSIGGVPAGLHLGKSVDDTNEEDYGVDYVDYDALAKVKPYGLKEKQVIHEMRQIKKCVLRLLKLEHKLNYIRWKKYGAAIIYRNMSQTKLFTMENTTGYILIQGATSEELYAEQSRYEKLYEETQKFLRKKNTPKVCVTYSVYTINANDTLTVRIRNHNKTKWLNFKNYEIYTRYDKMVNYYRCKSALQMLHTQIEKRKIKQKIKSMPKVDHVQQIHYVDIQAPPKRKRGRPRGSKNKPKNVAVTA